jgi:peptidoglycan/LPS O-acetylase OafA/YrhL
MVIDAYTGPGRVVSFFFENWFFSQLPIFALGILAYFIFVKIRHTTSPELGWVLIICSSFFFFNLLTINEVYGAFLPELFYYGLIFLLIIIGVYLAAPAIIINPFTIWVGRISFSLYLIHFIVIDFLLTIFPAGIIGLGKTINFFVFFIFTIILSCLISHITYKYIEAPGMQAGRTLIQKINQTSRSHTANI